MRSAKARYSIFRVSHVDLAKKRIAQVNKIKNPAQYLENGDLEVYKTIFRFKKR